MRLAASLSERLLAAGYPVTLVTNGVDVETHEEFPRMEARGATQTEEIFRVLARVDLKPEKRDFAGIVEGWLQEPDFEQAGYILISPSMKMPLQQAFSTLASSASALYVTPLYGNMESRMEDSLAFSHMRWEVKGFA